jgi:hypothetical protein
MPAQLTRAERRFRDKLVRKGKTEEATNFYGFNRPRVGEVEMVDRRWFLDHPGTNIYVRPFIPGEYDQARANLDATTGDWKTVKYVVVAMQFDKETRMPTIYRKPFPTQEDADGFVYNALVKAEGL